MRCLLFFFVELLKVIYNVCFQIECVFLCELLLPCATSFSVCARQAAIILSRRSLSGEEIRAAQREASAKGLPVGPGGWMVAWNNHKGCRRWISPDNKRRCECISKALAYSVKMGWIAEDSVPPPSKRQQHSTIQRPGRQAPLMM